MNRRDALALLATAIALPRAAIAQPASEQRIVGILMPSTVEIDADFTEAVRKGLSDAGFVEGQNLTLAMRYANGVRERLTPLAAELATLKPRVIVTSTDAAVLAVKTEMQMAADCLGIELRAYPVRNVDELDDAFASIHRDRTDALYVSAAPLFFANRGRILALTQSIGTPTFALAREYVLDGLLMSYGVDFLDPWRRLPRYIAKILAGAKLGDLPIEQPTKYRFVINLKTAKALGITIAPTLLATATEVIE